MNEKLRMDLPPFGRGDTDEVVRRLLGESAPEVREALWQHSRGNALYLRELVVGSVAAGRIALHGDVWVLAQPLVGSPHLAEYLLQSVRRLEPVSDAGRARVQRGARASTSNRSGRLMAHPRARGAS